jgi:hypothetical protein
VKLPTWQRAIVVSPKEWRRDGRSCRRTDRDGVWVARMSVRLIEESEKQNQKPGGRIPLPSPLQSPVRPINRAPNRANLKESFAAIFRPIGRKLLSRYVGNQRKLKLYLAVILLFPIAEDIRRRLEQTFLPIPLSCAGGPETRTAGNSIDQGNEDK